MTKSDVEAFRNLLNNERDRWRLDSGDWMGYAEELLDEVERLRGTLEMIAGGEADHPETIAHFAING